nr:ankyrin repeat domain-containing protein [uncultured Rhodoferax sp.]
MPQSDEYRDYDYVIGLLTSGGEAQWQEFEQLIDGFPDGVDEFLGRRWITNAIDCGSVASVRWMLARKVDLRFRDNEGYTVLHSALDREGPEGYELLELLLDAGADVNAKGVNDWTPAHMAAVREDLEALRILVKNGADLAIRTNIDSYATPLEEARHLKKLAAVEFLEAIGNQKT